MEPGDRFRLIGDPGRIGVFTGKVRESSSGLLRQQIVFPDGPFWVPADQLEALPEGPEHPLDLLKKDLLGRAIDLRRALTHVRLSGRLANIIYSMDTTGTDFYAFQFKPILKLLKSPTNGLLIADEVGLGKTIEAGLIWTELRARFDYRRLFVLCPAMLREKWQQELYSRFGVRASILSAKDALERLQAAELNPIGESFAIVASLQGLRPNTGWEELESGGGPSSELARFLESRDQGAPLIDVLVIDEAHYLRNPETKTAHLGRLMRGVAEYILLLSATPVHLKSHDLFQLLNLADQDTFGHPGDFDDILTANEPLLRARDRLLRKQVDVEALRNDLQEASQHPFLEGNLQLQVLLESPPRPKDLSDPVTRAGLARRLDRLNLLSHTVTRTRKREVKEWTVVRHAWSEAAPMTPVERRFYETVTDVVREYCARRAAHEGFLLVTPQRQMSSSMPAALASWQQRADSPPDLIYEDFGVNELRPGEEMGPLVSELVRRVEELGNLEQLVNSDSKYARLRKVLSRYLDEFPDEKVVLFSYFRGTLSYLHERLLTDGYRSTILMGGGADKQEILQSFQSPDGPSILLSSEVGSEGIDLQFSRVVINYDLPWNPMKVEQRIGRVDRLGQSSDTVKIWNIFYEDTIDARIYDRLYMRLGIFEKSLGGLEPILGDKVQELGFELLSRSLSREEEELRIDQTALALENKRRDQDQLEEEAAHLVAFGDYILQEVHAAKELKRRITEEDIFSYVSDFFTVHFPGCEFQQISSEHQTFEVSLSTQARFELEKFLHERKLGGLTRLHAPGISTVLCRFENTTKPAPLGRTEIISQFHPLVRFVSAQLSTEEELHKPAAAIQLPITSWPKGIRKATYVFSVQKWSLRGLQEQERLWFAAAPLGHGSNALGPSQAEQLIVAASSHGRDWLGASPDIDLRAAAEIGDSQCLEPSLGQFRDFSEQERLQNEDRANLQEKTLEKHFRNQMRMLREVQAGHQARGRESLVKATEGRIRALEDRVERKKLAIEERRQFASTCDDICVGLIRPLEN